MSYRSCSQCERKTAKEKRTMSYRRTFFPKFTSQEKSFAAALHQDMQHQQPQAPKTDGKSLQLPCAAASATTGNSENKPVSTGSLFI
jgi:hypothetical protein